MTGFEIAAVVGVATLVILVATIFFGRRKKRSTSSFNWGNIIPDFDIDFD